MSSRREMALHPVEPPEGGEAKLTPPWEQWPGYPGTAEQQFYRYGFEPLLWIYTERTWYVAVALARLRTSEFIAYRCRLQLKGGHRVRRIYVWGSDAVRLAQPPGRHLGLLVPARPAARP